MPGMHRELAQLEFKTFSHSPSSEFRKSDFSHFLGLVASLVATNQFGREFRVHFGLRRSSTQGLWLGERHVLHAGRAPREIGAFGARLVSFARPPRLCGLVSFFFWGGRDGSTGMALLGWVVQM